VYGKVTTEPKRKGKQFRLNANDLKILKVVYDCQDLKIQEIVEKTGLSEITVKRRLKILREQKILSKKYAVNYWKIGLSPLMVVGQNLLEKLDKEFVEFFVKSVRMVFISVPYQILDLVVPTEDLYHILKYLYECLGEVEVYFLKSFHESISFRFYDMESNDWKVNFLALSLYIKEIMAEEEYVEVLKQNSIVKTINEVHSSKMIKLSWEDMKIIHSLRDFSGKGFLSPELNLNFSKSKIYRMRRKLENLGVLKPYIDIYPPKLSEKMFLIIDEGDKQFLDALILGLSELPKFSYCKASKLDSTGEVIKDNVIIAKLHLPEGGFMNFIENFTKILIDKVDFKLYLETGPPKFYESRL